MTLFLFILALCVVSGIALAPRYKAYKRKKIANTPFKKEWRKIIQRRIPYFKKMPVDLQLQLKKHIQVFLSEKEFVGLNGITINDEIRLTIAAQACLLILNRKTNYYPKLKSILIYPSSWVKQHSTSNSDGIHFTQHMRVAGESWGYGKIVLSWNDTLSGADNPDDGHNLVIHEFAHRLDQEDGSSNGAPILSQGQSYEQWSAIFSKEYEQLKSDIARNRRSVFDSYGATNPAEFFAVASEVFFEKSAELKEAHPELYQQMSTYYRIDPCSW